MKTQQGNMAYYLASLCLGLVIGLSQTAYAGELDFDDAQNAKVSRFKAKGRVLQNELMDKSIPDDVEGDVSSGFEEEKCGVVDIGNVTNDKPFGTPQQVDVIITGDVINAGNNCK